MKRKLLFEFADWLERSRAPFDISDGHKCVSFHACRFMGEVKGNTIRTKGQNARVCSDNRDLVRIFAMPSGPAIDLYCGFNSRGAHEITRKVAAKVIRKLARTGDVDYGEFAETL